MSNIYDEALEHVKNGSDDLYSYQVLSIKQALERAKKVEELLGMYQQIETDIPTKMLKRIRELEEELK